MPPEILVITGPTATGKTRLGVLLAGRLGGEVISADSMQLYRRMDIGTAKPTAEERAGVPHHMLDCAGPEERYSAARYAREAGAVADALLAAGKLPVVVGGTGLYIDALIGGGRFEARDTALRAALSADYDREGGPVMRERLRQVDPESGEKLHPNDKKRIVRALEVYYRSGRPVSAHNAETRQRPPRYAAMKIALTYRDRAALYAKIDRRVDDMLAAGFLEEARGLEGLPEDATARQAIGYKELLSVLSGDMSLAEATEKIKRESRRYAKRQLTWLRRDPAIHWIQWEWEPDFRAAAQNVARLWAEWRAGRK